MFAHLFLKGDPLPALRSFFRLAVSACLGLFAGAALFGAPARADVITRLPTNEKVVALTFDACEALKPVKLDHGIADYLVARRIPFTIFMGGLFARDNANDVKALAANDFVEIENHSYSHNNNMPGLSDARVRSEVLRAQSEIFKATGRVTHFFRFPAGHYDARTLSMVEAMGYRVVHWRWPEGDPDAQESADMLVRRTLKGTEPGDILIFHINGRGVHTSEALPRVIDGLEAEGYRFVLLKDYLPPPPPQKNLPAG